MHTSRIARRLLLTTTGAAALTGALTLGAGRPAAAHPSQHRPHERLFTQWVALWNGGYDHAEAIIAPDFRVHAALLDGGDGSAVRGPAGLIAWITQTRAAFTDLRFSVQVGPLVDDAHVVGRWNATGTYGGGFPGATAAPGTRVAFTGTDTLRVARGRFAEYWVNSDVHVLLAQLGVRS